MEDKRALYYKIDFLSLIPTLRIFSNNNYKTNWGVFVSLISLFISICFFIYSFKDFLKFNNPNIISIKESSTSIKRTINLNETLLLFKITDFYDSYKSYIDYDPKEIKFFLSAVLTEYFYDNSKNSTEYSFLLEKCELGKTINLNLKEKIEEFEKYTDESYTDYYCINANENLELYYYPNYGYNELKIYTFISNDTFNTHYSVKSKIIVADDTINNYNRSFPIIRGFKEFSSSKFEKKTYSLVNIDLDFFKYESDNSIFIETNTKNYSGVSFGDSYTQLLVEGEKYDLIPNYDFFDNKETYLLAAEQYIKIGQKKYFDSYKRSYTKIQSFIAEVKSIIDIVISACTFLTNIVSKKKMKIDIIISLLKKKFNIKSRHFANYKSIGEYSDIYNEINLINDTASESKNSSDRKILIQNNLNNSLKLLKSQDQKTSERLFEKVCFKNKISNALNEKILEKITICDILRSYLCCCKNWRINLVNSCVDIANKELCIDRILNRLLKLEKMYYLSNDDLKAKIQLMESPDLKEVNETLIKYKNSILNLNKNNNKIAINENNI